VDGAGTVEAANQVHSGGQAREEESNGSSSKIT